MGEEREFCTFMRVCVCVPVCVMYILYNEYMLSACSCIRMCVCAGLFLEVGVQAVLVSGDI